MAGGVSTLVDVTSTVVDEASTTLPAAHSGNAHVEKRTVATRGCGNVELNLAIEPAKAGARLAVSNVDPEHVWRTRRGLGARAVPPEASILDLPSPSSPLSRFSPPKHHEQCGDSLKRSYTALLPGEESWPTRREPAKALPFLKDADEENT